MNIVWTGIGSVLAVSNAKTLQAVRISSRRKDGLDDGNA